jgi:presqualene diphosphate synthase
MVSDAIALPIPEAEDPKQYVSDVTRASGSSFFLPMLLLPRARREGMLALYAFCRETDDVADEIEDIELSGRLLDAWRGEINAVFSGAPSHPVGHALIEPIRRFDLEKEPFLEILDGFDMDRSGAMVRPTLKELELYCHRVASCVGLVSVKVFGCRSSGIPEFAEHLGQAFQLTNIMRDVAEDGARGRIYLPMELLEKEGLSKIAPEDLAATPGVDRVCRELGAMAREHFRLASAALPRAERRKMRPALLMRSVYEAYLNEIERREFRVDGPRIRFGTGKKIFLLVRGLLSTLF